MSLPGCTPTLVRQQIAIFKSLCYRYIVIGDTNLGEFAGYLRNVELEKQRAEAKRVAQHTEAKALLGEMAVYLQENGVVALPLYKHTGTERSRELVKRGFFEHTYRDKETLHHARIGDGWLIRQSWESYLDGINESAWLLSTSGLCSFAENAKIVREPRDDSPDVVETPAIRLNYLSEITDHLVLNHEVGNRVMQLAKAGSQFAYAENNRDYFLW